MNLYWSRLDCKSSLNSLMHLQPITELYIAIVLSLKNFAIPLKSYSLATQYEARRLTFILFNVV
jgi:hypothetical protein